MSLPSTFRYLFSLLLSFGALLSTLSAQGNGDIDPCSGGTLYYIAFPDTTTNSQDARFAAHYPEEFFLYIYSPVDQEVRVSRTNTTATVVESVFAGDILEFDTKKVSVPMVSVRNRPETNVLKVESESPVIIYTYMATRFGCAAFTPIPVDAWGREYYAATWEGEYVRNIMPAGENNYNAMEKVPAPAEILVIAAYDDTEVIIDPTDSLADCLNCRHVTLRAGEAYLVQSFVDTGVDGAAVEVQPDIAGTSIRSSKPIGVISGNTRTWHEPFADGFLAGNAYKDMAAEWIAPVTQHGKEFVFMPTWDNLRQRPDAETMRDKAYVRIYATTDASTRVASSDSLKGFSREEHLQRSDGEFWHVAQPDLRNAVFYRTTEPSQAHQSPRPVTRFEGLTGSGNYIGAQYSTWGTYMVEMMPREQWISSAPLFAPSYPSGMDHYVNVVTDSASQFNIYYYDERGDRKPFPFDGGNIEMEGTSLVWGALGILSGQSYMIEGENGARFGGFVYGSWKGLELYRAGRTEKEDDAKERSTVAGHPSEYEENVAMMYGYPLAPSRCVLEQPDEYDVETESDCGIMMITIRAADTNAAGLRFVRLVEDALLNENVRLEFIEPVGGLTEESVRLVRLRLSPVDPLRDARGVVEFRDRTRDGEIRRIEYSYTAERLEADPIEIDFGSVTVNEPAGERLVTLSNPLDRDVTVRGLGFAFGDREFVITRSEPNFDWSGGNDSIVLKSGQSLKVWIDVTPRSANMTSADSLKVMLGCLSIVVPVHVTTAQPCLFVSDLHFGVMSLGETKTLPLRICNIGKGRVTFHDSGSGKAFLSWLLDEFRVSQTDMQKLAGAVLEEQQCLSINVTFGSEEFTGNFRTVARFWANTRSCRDTSVWTAQVVIPGPIVEGYDWGERWVTAQNPCTRNQLTGYDQTIRLSNTGDADFMVRRVEIADDPDGVYRIVDTGSGATGFVIRPGAMGTVRIAFEPTEQKAYSAHLRLHYTMNGAADSLDGLLDGIGIESCIQISDLDIVVDTVRASERKGTGRLQLRSTGTRPVTLSNLWLAGADASDFSFVGGAPSLPMVIPAGESRELEVLFAPSDNRPTERRMWLSVEGDFAYVDCPGTCSDSSAVLSGVLGTLSVEEGESVAGYAIRSISPNPFSRDLEITFALGTSGLTTVQIYDAQGRMVRELLREELEAGEHRIEWDGTNAAAGIYHVRIRSGAWNVSRQVVLVR